MSLTLVAVPIGHPEDITLRALKQLQGADLVIGEERKPLFRLFANLDIGKPKDFRLLNEHSTPEDLAELVELCKGASVVLVTDCGTPGFCDPGANLVAACRKNKIPCTSAPGPCSLSTFLSLCGEPLKQFYFQGFLPREKGDRLRRLQTLDKFHRPFVMMDTPYRLSRCLEQLDTICPQRQVILGVQLTKDDEAFYRGTAKKILKAVEGQKKEFLLAVL